ncbi:MAG: hypothetical protein ACRCTZ_16140 [Sarcina sp.]
MNKVSFIEKMKAEKLTAGVFWEEVVLTCGSSIEDAYNFMLKTKFSKEMLHKGYWIVYTEFNGKIINTEMSIDEMYVITTGLNRKQHKEREMKWRGV